MLSLARVASAGPLISPEREKPRGRIGTLVRYPSSPFFLGVTIGGAIQVTTLRALPSFRAFLITVPAIEVERSALSSLRREDGLEGKKSRRNMNSRRFLTP